LKPGKPQTGIEAESLSSAFYSPPSPTTQSRKNATIRPIQSL
jgi:hypothetical protein